MAVRVNLYDITEGKLCFVHVTRDTALALIESLSHQLLTGSPNSGRLESRSTGDAQEFSIAVVEKV
jgi:hypothetical protein